MTDEIKRDRSPNFPKVPLEQAVEMVHGLHKKAGRSQIGAGVAASALGYSGLNGAALTALGVLNQYGLIERQRGEGVSVSHLAVRLIHPVNAEQSLAAKRESALKPKVFSELLSRGFQHCAEEILSNHLVQNGFTPDGAKRAASVFKENVEFAQLTDDSIKRDSDTHLTPESVVTETQSKPDLSNSPASTPPERAKKNVLATYAVPIGANEVEITFTGDVLRPEDFDALADYVDLFKKQYTRKLAFIKDPTSKEATDPSGDLIEAE